MEENTAKANDPFSDFDENDFGQAPPQPEPKQAEPKKTAVKAGGRSAFQPAESSDDFGGSFGEAFDQDTIFDFAADAFEQKITDEPKPSASGEKTYANTPRKSQLKQVIGEDEANVSAVFYVEMLEMATIVVCEWISGAPGSYRFKESLKQKHAEMAAKLMVHENIYISPQWLFLLSGIVLLGGSVVTAFKDKKKRRKLEEFTAKSNRVNINRKAGEALTLFDVDPIVQGRTKFEAVMEDNVAYYVQKPNGGYCKKSEREEVPPELVSELFNFHSRNSAWPTKKQVEAFLKQA